MRFTLIELMMAVAIATILSSIALPTFSDYLTRGRSPQLMIAVALLAILVMDQRAEAMRWPASR
jgi:type IV pilus assembly protein PilE